MAFNLIWAEFLQLSTYVLSHGTKFYIHATNSFAKIITGKVLIMNFTFYQVATRPAVATKNHKSSFKINLWVNWKPW